MYEFLMFQISQKMIFKKEMILLKERTDQASAQSRGGKGGRTPPLPDLNKFICLKQNFFLCYPLNCRREEFFVSSFLFKKREPRHKF